MKFLFPLILLGGLAYLFLQKRIEQETAKLIQAGVEDPEYQEHQKALQRLVVYRTLRDSVKEGMTLEELIDAFSRMCAIGVGEPDDLLFETGTFSFTGEKLFYFSLVRQFQFLDEDEYVQLHLDVRYQPSPATALLQKTEWGQVGGEFFERVKNSSAYKTLKDKPIAQVEVYVDET